MLADDPLTWRWIAAMSSRHVEIMLNLVAGLLVESTATRVAARLTAMARAGDGGGFTLELSQQELAQLCGVSRNTIHRVLTTFEKRRIVLRRYRRLEIVDLDALERIATQSA